MDILNTWISAINDVLWSYILIIMLLGLCRLVYPENSFRTIPHDKRNDKIAWRFYRKI